MKLYHFINYEHFLAWIKLNIMDYTFLCCSIIHEINMIKPILEIVIKVVTVKLRIFTN